MQFGRFRLGMRTTKTALAVFLCILFFHVSNRGLPMIAALSAVFSLRQDLTTTVSFGRSRIIGNTLGGLLGIFYFFVKNYFHNNFLVELFLISLSIPQGESSLYAIQRVLDTFIGTFIAIGINFFLRPPEIEKKEELAEDLVELKKREERLREDLAKVEEQIKKQNNHLDQ